MSMQQPPTTIWAVYLPFMLFVIATVIVWGMWGKSATLLILVSILALILVRDYALKQK